MGALCSVTESEDVEKDKDAGLSHVSRLHKKQRDDHLPASMKASHEDMKAARQLISAQYASIGGAQGASVIPLHFNTTDDYHKKREQLLQSEKALDFDHRCRLHSTADERRVDRILMRKRRDDQLNIYGKARPREGYRGQLHPRFPGDHFLSNVSLINRSSVFEIASQMPKGAHLHIHFNACLMPQVLLNIAKGMDRMFIMSDMPLIPEANWQNFNRCEITFSIVLPENENPGDLFSASYKPKQTMRFRDFLACFSQYYQGASADEWLLEKLVFHEEEAHNFLQTAAGAWEKFNGRTRMMKGLFNYETAYKEYTRLCLEDFMRDNIQYAEIRPNFMMSNQLYRDDGSGTIDNEGIMEIIIDEVKKFQRRMAQEKQFFGGLKVIYCTPRSFAPEKIKAALDECIKFKKQWPEWIAGFDLVGEEGKGEPIKTFVPELLDFQRKCREEHLEIPFLFHCGETLDMGTDTDQNLVDALLLNSKRIGHGFALAKHPLIMQHMKERNICLELCPISNEILGLTPRVSGHAMYQLLANNVHCTVSSDNGTLFRSSLSHDFYQVMVGKADMGIFGWKQLALWSLEHACLDEQEYADILANWQVQWDEFIRWVISNYGDESDAA